MLTERLFSGALCCIYAYISQCFVALILDRGMLLLCYQKQCERLVAEIRRRYKPSLFQHIGVHSSLKGKVQKLKVCALNFVWQLNFEYSPSVGMVYVVI